ncbi:synaptotagmin-16 isoform X1 [Diabrotica undecimpunctata]|uniref:synaptotagmin-16 isoform X1 n=2 Tax=Diabrotica undecimpunctata TaxID=50387 RepID=UPI003B63F8E9
MFVISGQSYIGDGGTMLGAMAGLGAILLVFVLYVRNKGLIWWTPIRGMACCDEACPPISTRPIPTPSVPNFISHASPKTKLGKAYSFDGGESSSESEMGQANKTQQGHSPISVPVEPSSLPFYPTKPNHDLISLVEKGRVGVSSNSSCCSSTTSSVGEKHKILSTKVTAEINNSLQKTPINLRETKIDNHSLEIQMVNTSAQIDTVDNNTTRDCIVVMAPDVEDRGEVMSYGEGSGSEPDCQVVPSKCGHLEIALLYDAPMRKMTVHVLQARDFPSRDRGQLTNTQVRLILLPSKKQKHKTKIRQGDNPQYMENFVLHRVNPEDVNSMGLRLRLYGCERMRRERLIGEAIVSFANINLELENNFWLNLEPKANTTMLGGCAADLLSLARSDSTGSAHSMQHGGVPELLLGLCYNATTGRLNVEVIKGSHFSYLLRNLAINRPPDTYVKLYLVSSTGQELAQSKTSVRRGQPNPLFKETFIFQVALFQLADVTLMVSVYNRKGVTKKKEMLGWFSLGLNSSGAEELAHWMDMKEFQQEQISRWHILVQS